LGGIVAAACNHPGLDVLNKAGWVRGVLPDLHAAEYDIVVHKQFSFSVETAFMITPETGRIL
jgi:hypothetical protein